MGYPKRSREDKIAAAAAYASTGSQKKASELSGVPKTTLCDWINNQDPEFTEYVDKAQAEFEAELPLRFAHAMDLCFDRLEETISTATAGVAATVLGISFDKTRILANKPTTISGKSIEDVEKRLEESAKLMEKYGRRAVGNINTKIKAA